MRKLISGIWPKSPWRVAVWVKKHLPVHDSPLLNDVPSLLHGHGGGSRQQKACYRVTGVSFAFQVCHV